MGGASRAKKQRTSVHCDSSEHHVRTEEIRFELMTQMDLKIEFAKLLGRSWMAPKY